MKCKIQGCTSIYYSGDFYKKHYDANRRHGDPLYNRILKKDQVCKIPGCAVKVHANGLRAKHRMQERRKDPEYRKKEVASTARWKKANPEKAAAQQANYGKKYAKELYEKRKEWREANWVYYKAYLQSVKEHSRRATPKWVDNKEIIKFIQNRPDGHDVDHIIPLRGKEVSGLNVL